MHGESVHGVRCQFARSSTPVQLVGNALFQSSSKATGRDIVSSNHPIFLMVRLCRRHTGWRPRPKVISRDFVLSPPRYFSKMSRMPVSCTKKEFIENAAGVLLLLLKLILMLSKTVLDDKGRRDFPHSLEVFSRIDTMVQKKQEVLMVLQQVLQSSLGLCFVRSCCCCCCCCLDRRTRSDVSAAQQASPAKPASGFRALPWQLRRPLPASARLPVFIHFCPHAPTLCLHCRIWREEGGGRVAAAAAGRGYQQRQTGLPRKKGKGVQDGDQWL